ncbi:MAG: ABC transporter ATP-binding protein [Dysgonamonadaceae bacterium]|jgi:ABC-2 type transport system ATP-binding protein|nr:ABC transporter ATP-binding protein [Dysgonamonadaceae bacterium]
MIIEIKNLSKTFDGTEKLNIPGLQIEENEIIGLVGNNGAGKTTLLRLVLNLLKTTSGSILIQSRPTHETVEWKNITGSFLDEGFLIDFLTPEEYFYFIGEAYGINNKEVNIILNDFIPFMGDEIIRKKKRIDKFSKGNKEKIGIIGAMLIRPKLLILDEPFNFLDPSSQLIMKKLLQTYNQKYNTTILFSSHNIQYVMDICTRIIIIDSGKIIYDKPNTADIVKIDLYNYFNKVKK